MSTTIGDFFEEAAQAASDEATTGDIGTLATALIRLENEQAKKEEELKEITAQVHKLRTTLLPDAMARANCSEFRLNAGPYSGVKIEVGDFVTGSLPKEPQKRGRAVAYLESLGAGGLLQTSVVVNVPKSKQNEVVLIVERIREIGYEAEVIGNVHHSSLQALGREMLRNGEPFEPDTLGLYIGRAAKVHWPREKSNGR